MLKLAQIQEHVSLASHTTMNVGGSCDYFMAVRTLAEVKDACDWATTSRMPIFILGEGSNVVISDAPLHMLVLKMEVGGFEKIADDSNSLTLKIGAGEHWDDVVDRTVKLGLSGIEAMSAIPGTAGAAPVQNAGAYGQEIADTLVEVNAYDTLEKEFVKILHNDCGFEYRTSRFKTEAAGRYVITGLTIKLSKKAPATPTYESLKRFLEERHIVNPSVQQIRDSVIAVRARILPDPSVVPNSGSFFKNPIVSAEALKKLEKSYKKVPSYKYGENYKLAAGWIVEQCGFKGSEHFGLQLWPNHALVITNPHGAGYADLMKLVDLIVRTVQDKFGITLEPEPQFVHEAIASS